MLNSKPTTFYARSRKGGSPRPGRLGTSLTRYGMRVLCAVWGRYTAVQCGSTWCVVSGAGMAWHGMAWHGMAWHGMASYGMDNQQAACYGILLQYDVAFCGALYGVVCVYCVLYGSYGQQYSTVWDGMCV
jgi:hypothetical protein